MDQEFQGVYDERTRTYTTATHYWTAVLPDGMFVFEGYGHPIDNKFPNWERAGEIGPFVIFKRALND